VMYIPEEEYRFSAEPYLADLAPFFGDIVGIEQTLSLFRIHGANNWSNPIDIENRSLENHEVRVKVLNYTLNNLGVDAEVSLVDHWPYQRLRHKLGYEKKLINLSRLIFQNPWEVRLTSKLKAVFKLWFFEPSRYWFKFRKE